MRDIEEIAEDVIAEYLRPLTREEKLERWGEGPWLDEPDRVEFRHMGLPCLITRNPEMGSLCGYVAVPPGHPWHRKFDPPVVVHGSCNYASPCSQLVCHVPEPGEPDNVWWFGFDCGRAFDLVPGFMALVKLDPALESPLTKLFERHIYRDYPYVEAHVRSLAEQLHALRE